MILEPWPHIVIDNFLTDKALLDLQKRTMELNKLAIKQAEENGDTKGHYRHHCKDDPLEAYDIMGLFSQFEIKRQHNNLTKLVQIIKTCKDAEYPIHEDAPHKIFSLILYIWPEENMGTNVYDENKNFVHTIEWKPNRAVMFCPLDNVTYHDYGSSTDRFTLMYNLINEELK